MSGSAHERLFVNIDTSSVAEIGLIILFKDLNAANSDSGRM